MQNPPFTVSIQPEDEKVFLTEIQRGLYFKLQASLQLADRVLLEFKSAALGNVSVPCEVVGRCFEGKSTTPSSIKLVALKSHHHWLKNLLAR